MQCCMREIFLYCAMYDIEVLASHAPGTSMQRSNALSREHLDAKYARMVAEDTYLQAATRLEPDDRLFMLINEL